jgi:hypothetical protein
MESISNNPGAIVAICVFATGFVVCAGLGISRMLGTSDDGVKEQSDAQRLHMAEVRRRYIEMLKYEV